MESIQIPMSFVVHEIFHHLDCGGDFVAGFYQLDGEMGFGATFCERDLKWGEVIPHLLSVIIIVTAGYFKIKREFWKQK